MTIAFFDVDETIISVKSMFIFYKYFSDNHGFKSGISYREFMRRIELKVSQGAARSDINSYYYSLFEGESQRDIRAAAMEMYLQGMMPVFENVSERIRWHQRNADDIVFISGAMVDIIYPIMERFSVRQALCSDPEVKKGFYTGTLLRQSIGAQKGVLARKWLEASGQDASACYAYGDHHSDIDLLLSVGNSVAVNPCPELHKMALKKEWEILYTN